MKKLFLLVIAVLATMPIFAATNTMNYQAIISNPDGTPAANREIGLKFLIASDTQTLFTEETKTMTSDMGLAEYAIGSSALPNGISAIDWSSPGLRLEVWIDLNGGQNYTTAYSSTIQSVPTALYAEKSGDSQALRHQIDATKADLEAIIADNRYRIEDVRNHTEAYTDAKVAALESLIYSKIASLESDINALNNIIANLGGGDIDNALLQAKLDEIRTYADAIGTENRYLINDVRADLSRTIEDLHAELENLRSYADAVSSENRYMVDAVIASLESRINSEIGSLRDENNMLKDDIDNLAAIIADLTKKVEALSK